MNYPSFLEKGDYIGICAPSSGISDEDKKQKLDVAISNLKNMGYNILETPSVRKDEFGRSASAKIRAKEFMELYENPKVKLIIFASGGDFLCEMIDYLDFDKIKNLPAKWLQGYSDITGISYLFNTILNIPTLYAQTIKDYAMNPLYRNLIDALKIVSGENVKQDSFEKYEKIILDYSETSSKDSGYSYNLTEKNEWKNINNMSIITFEGRSVGGCLDCVKTYIGTKYDNISDYIEEHKEEGIIWFLESYETSTSELFRTLWQMKNAGYFKYCNGIIFGRPLMVREEYGVSYIDTVTNFFNDLNIKVIFNADIGHIAPQMAILNGGYLKIISENGKGSIETYYK